MKYLFAVVCIGVLGVNPQDRALAFSFPTPPAQGSGPSALLMDDDYDFEGILGLSNCSGSLVRFDDSEGSDPGLVLSNGHCVGMIDPGVVLTDRSSYKRFTVLDEDGSRIGSLRARRLLYATMTDTDLSLFELRESYDDILTRYGIAPLTFARSAAKPGELSWPWLLLRLVLDSPFQFVAVCGILHSRCPASLSLGTVLSFLSDFSNLS